MDLPPNPVVANEVVIANDERTSRENKREHPLSQVNVEQEEKLNGLSLDGLSSIVSKEKAVTHHTAEGARAQAKVSLVIKEDRKPEGEVKDSCRALHEVACTRVFSDLGKSCVYVFINLH